MKTVILALAGVLIGGGMGTGGGAFLLARCSADVEETHGEGVETHEDDGATPADSVSAEDAPEVDTVGALGPVPDLAGEAAENPADSTAAADAGADEASTEEPTTAALDEVDGAGADAPPPGAVDPAAPAVEPIVLAPTPDPTALRRLARIFSNMKAEQAAAVMVELSDAEAQRILVSMPERAAAAILGKMDASRAAVLSRRVLGTGSGGDT